MVWCANDNGTGKDGPSSSATSFVSVGKRFLEVTKVSPTAIGVKFENLAKTEIDIVSLATGMVVYNQGLTDTDALQQKVITIFDKNNTNGASALSPGKYLIRVLAKYQTASLCTGQGCLLESAPFEILKASEPKPVIVKDTVMSCEFTSTKKGWSDLGFGFNLKWNIIGANVASISHVIVTSNESRSGAGFGKDGAPGFGDIETSGSETVYMKVGEVYRDYKITYTNTKTGASSSCGIRLDLKG